MALKSPSPSTMAKLVYGSGADADASINRAANSSREGDLNDAGDSIPDERDNDGKSMYVRVFEDMLMEVLSVEYHLFLEHELDCFEVWHKLPYEAKYLFCRLCLRKLDKWHKLSDLNYEQELGSEGILKAIDTLCGCAEEVVVKPEPEPEVLSGVVFDALPPNHFAKVLEVKPKNEPQEPSIPKSEDGSVPSTPDHAPAEPQKPKAPEIIDLTLDDDEEQPQAGPSRLSPVYEPPPPPSSAGPSPSPGAVDYSRFADDEEQADIFELLECLNTRDLEDLAKELKLKPRGAARRDTLIDAILRGTARQTTLPFARFGQKGKVPLTQTKLKLATKKTQKSLTQAKLPFKPTPETVQTQQQRLRDMVLQKLKKCIRLNNHVVALFRRVNLVYFRSTQYTEAVLTPAILQCAKRRAYAQYEYTRTKHIWPSRQALLDYEEALRIEAEVDALLESSYGGSSQAGHERSTTSRTPAPGRLRTPATPVKSEASVAIGDGMDESERMRNARKVKAILDGVFPRWTELVADAEKNEEPSRANGLERFNHGHILTRVVCKGAAALGVLREHQEELLVLKALLKQRQWRRGRRGKWYDRCALVLMNHLKEDDRALEEAKEVVTDALTDPDTHIVYRPMLERRLTRLEKVLNVPPEDRHVCHGKLKRPIEVCVEGVRVYHRGDSLVLDKAGKAVNKPAEQPGKLSWANREEPSPKKKVKEEGKAAKWTGKSIWRGRDDKEVHVEDYALEWYQDQHDCQGYHCEGRIVTTLFGLLFWDVIFAHIPGAFETPYQSAPLDLVEDTFYHSRKALADARLVEIQQGHAADILARTYDKHKDVMCVGIRWDLFPKEHLVSIAKCLDPTVLAVMCQTMCEDYASRTSGVPDLIVWNEEAGYAKFVEVKGPGDALQENQKLWIDVLLQAGMPVELCHVHEPGKKPKTRSSAGKTRKKEKTPAPGRKRKRDGWLVESEDEEVDYSQLDRHSDDEGDPGPGPELGADPPAKRRRIQDRGSGDLGSDSPSARKVARIDSQVEVTRSPLRSWSRAPSSSPSKRKRGAGE